MDVPIGVEVKCADEVCGRSTYVVINPATEKITHLVVKERAFPNQQRLVPIEEVSEATPQMIRLRCTTEELAAKKFFLEREYIEMPPIEAYAYAPGEMMFWPYVIPDPELIDPAIKHENIPEGELAIRRHTPVLATDGSVGRVDEFLVDPTAGGITHLVLRHGHLWGQRDVTVPVSAIARLEEEAVHLKLSRDDVGKLPSVPVRRWWA